MWTPVRQDLLHPCVFDAHLLAELKNLAAQPLALGFSRRRSLKWFAAQLRVWVVEVRAREIVWMTAERTRRGQALGRANNGRPTLVDMSTSANDRDYPLGSSSGVR